MREGLFSLVTRSRPMPLRGHVWTVNLALVNHPAASLEDEEWQLKEEAVAAMDFDTAGLAAPTRSRGNSRPATGAD